MFMIYEESASVLFVFCLYVVSWRLQAGCWRGMRGNAPRKDSMSLITGDADVGRSSKDAGPALVPVVLTGDWMWKARERRSAPPGAMHR